MLAAGWVGEQARTIIPPVATAELDIRLVKESDPERLIGLLFPEMPEQNDGRIHGFQLLVV